MNDNNSQQGMFPQDMLSQQTSPASVPMPVGKPLWELGINELAGRNLEASGRGDVNDMLQHGWILLHIYTLRYPEREGPRGPRTIWRERPMAILGRQR
jgi:hypothetical protein